MSRPELLPRLVEFWVEPADARPARRWRILFGCVLTVWFLGWIRGADLLLPDRLASARGVDSMISLPGGRVSWVVWAWAIVGMLASALLAAGVVWRPAAVVAAACAVSIIAHDRAGRNGGDLLIGTWALLTALAAAFDGGGWGRASSRRETLARATASPWLRRMLLCQLTIVYAASVLHKLAAPDWRSGMAVAYALNFGPWRLPVDPGVLLDVPMLSRILTWGTMLVELAIPLLLWRRRWQWWGVALVLALHLGIELTLDVGFFGIAMMVAAVCVPDHRLPGRRSQRPRSLAERSSGVPEPDASA